MSQKALPIRLPDFYFGHYRNVYAGSQRDAVLKLGKNRVSPSIPGGSAG